MSSYIVFHVHLILLIASVVIATLALIKRNLEALPAPTVTFLLSIIGLACSFNGFVREFSGIYGITWFG